MTVDQLAEFGIESMTAEECKECLESRSIGVLGLPADEGPYVLPFSYAFDGDSALYFTYLVGENSRKVQLSQAADRATFLVYSAETQFHWRSVIAHGSLVEIDQSEWETVTSLMEGRWRPEHFEAFDSEAALSIYELTIDELSGRRHTGLPGGFE